MKTTTTVFASMAMVALAMTMLVPTWAAASIEADAGCEDEVVSQHCVLLGSALGQGAVGEDPYKCATFGGTNCEYCCDELLNAYNAGGCDKIIGYPCYCRTNMEVHVDC